MAKAIKILINYDWIVAHWTFFPPWVWEGIVMVLVVCAVLAFICLNVLFLIWLERKICARIQRRMGPQTTGFKRWSLASMWLGGVFQTPADALKLLMKEDIIPSGVDRLIFIIAPFVVFTACTMAVLCIPIGPGLIPRDLNLGILYIIAKSTFTVISILMAGWASNNKYALLGAFRSASQAIGYEVPLIFALLGPVMMAGTLQMSGLIEAQRMVWFIIPQIVGFLVYVTAATAEVNRPPFDIPEAESELVAGYNIDYSGMRFAMFFLAEFANMLVVSAIAVTAFLGGWHLPFVEWPQVLKLGPISIPYFHILMGTVVFMVKTYCMVLLFMWIRWTFPRLRPDMLSAFGWKVLLPLAFANILITAGVLAIFPNAFRALGG